VTRGLDIFICIEVETDCSDRLHLVPPNRGSSSNSPPRRALLWRLTHPVAPESSLPAWQRITSEAVAVGCSPRREVGAYPCCRSTKAIQSGS
jgi:hypothetical protein